MQLPLHPFPIYLLIVGFRFLLPVFIDSEKPDGIEQVEEEGIEGRGRGGKRGEDGREGRRDVPKLSVT